MPPSRPKSRTQHLRITALKGVNRFADEARIPSDHYADALNVRLSRGTADPRAGFRKRYDVTTVLGDDLPVTGIGTWRFPADDDTPGTRHLLLFGQKDGAGALYSDTGLGLVDVTPMSGDKSLLIGAGLDAYFAELNYKSFMVNGRDGIVVYNGANTAANAAAAVDAMEQLPAPTLAKSFGSLGPFTTATWHSSDDTKIAATITAWDRLHPSSLYASAEQINVTAQDGSTGEWVYHKFDTPLDLTDAAFLSDHFAVAYACNAEAFVPLRLYIGRVDLSDSQTDPAAAGWNPDADSSAFWNLPCGDNDQVTYAHLPFDGVSDAIKQQVDYIALKAVNQKSALGDLLGSSPDSAVSEHWLFNLAGIFLPGYLSSGNTRYRLVPFDSEADTNGPASEMSSVECYEGLTDAQDSSVHPAKDLCRRVKITVDFTNVQDNVDEIHVYRAHHETDDETFTIEQFQWYEVATANRSDADGDNKVIVYDNLPEGQLTGDALKSLPFDESPTAFNDEAPWYICSTATRLLYARTKSNPNRVYASEVAKGSAVPNISIDDYDTDEVPHGGYADVGHDDGGSITGLFTRMNDTVIFKDNDVWLWTRANEYTSEESWQFTPLSAPGCVATRSICRIVGGVVYAGADGIYLLPDNSYQVIPTPLSEAVRGYFDAVPPSARHKIACTYDPVNRLLLVALPEEGESVPSCLAVYDTQTREWQGKWKSDGQSLKPGILYTDFVPSTGEHLVYLLDASTGKVWTQKTPGVDANPYGDGDANADVPCSVTTKYEELQGYKSKLVRRRLEFIHEEQSADEDGLTISNVALTVRSRPGSVTELTDYPDTTSDPTVETNGLIEFGHSSDGLERLPNLQGLEHQFTVSWDHAGTNAKPVRFLALTVSMVPAGRFN